MKRGRSQFCRYSHCYRDGVCEACGAFSQAAVKRMRDDFHFFMANIRRYNVVHER